MQNVIETLQARGFIDALTSEEIGKLTQQPSKVYCGFDPTADSLHIGHMVAMMGLAWFQRCGHTPVAVVGGATGMVGDPSGKSKERNLLDEAAIQKNLEGITKNLQAVLDFDHPDRQPLILNNYDWFQSFQLIPFLRDIGKHFRLGTMLAKDSVKSRLNSDEGISFTEFSYQLLQGYDFLHLFQEEGVAIQMGGSDQWGNITAGIDLIRRATDKQGYGITFPLLTRSDGKKFGKTEEGTIWLSPDRLSPFDFYQYLYRIPDVDVIRMMKMLTFVELEEISALEAEMKSDGYVPNKVQKRLAEEVTRIVHGEEGVRIATAVTQGISPGTETALDVASLEELAKHMPSQTIPKASAVDQKLVDLLVAVGLQGSRGEARRLVRNGGAYLNNTKIDDENFIVLNDHLLDGRLFLLGVGKKKKMVVRISG